MSAARLVAYPEYTILFTTFLTYNANENKISGFKCLGTSFCRVLQERKDICLTCLGEFLGCLHKEVKFVEVFSLECDSFVVIDEL